MISISLYNAVAGHLQPHVLTPFIEEFLQLILCSVCILQSKTLLWWVLSLASYWYFRNDRVRFTFHAIEGRHYTHQWRPWFHTLIPYFSCITFTNGLWRLPIAFLIFGFTITEPCANKACFLIDKALPIAIQVRDFSIAHVRKNVIESLCCRRIGRRQVGAPWFSFSILTKTALGAWYAFWGFFLRAGKGRRSAMWGSATSETLNLINQAVWEKVKSQNRLVI